MLYPDPEMAWQNPKLDWPTNPHNPVKDDFNRIEGNIGFLKTDIETKKGDIVDALNDVGISADLTDTHAQLSAKITAAEKTGVIITPSTVDQAIPKGIFDTGGGVVLGDADLLKQNIKYGVTMFGIAGEHFVEQPGEYTWKLTSAMTSGTVIMNRDIAIPQTFSFPTFQKTTLMKHIQLRWAARGSSYNTIGITFDVRLNGSTLESNVYHEVGYSTSFAGTKYDISSVADGTNVTISLYIKGRSTEDVAYFLSDDTAGVYAPVALY